VSETFDRLLAEMREGRLDLASLPLALLLDALGAALHGDGALTDKAGWIVTVAALLERRSRLLLPREAMAPRGPDAAETERLRAQPAGLAESRALALWLGARPQLGQDIFSRGGADTPGGEEDMALDVIEFLWASIAVFEGFLHEAIPLYQPAPAALHGITEARARILQRLAEAPAGLDLPALLPSEAGEALRRRSAWSSTFAAGLELAKGGAVILDQTTPQGLPLMRRSDV
jgi:segregation and condensation protein A